MQIYMKVWQAYDKRRVIYPILYSLTKPNQNILLQSQLNVWALALDSTTCGFLVDDYTLCTFSLFAFDVVLLLFITSIMCVIDNWQI